MHRLENKITVTWIPGHSNIAGNETADTLAKAAVQQSEVDIATTNENETHEKIQEYIIKKWQHQWNSATNGTYYKQIEPIVNTKIKYKHRSRHIETKITRLRLGKCCLNKYLKDIKCHETGLCRTCKVDETIEHYLLYCKERNWSKIISRM